jgi:hypothetical protein
VINDRQDEERDRPSLDAEEHAAVGVSDALPATKDEYDGYAGPLAALLRRGAAAKDVYDHLLEVETNHESLARWADHSSSG